MGFQGLELAPRLFAPRLPASVRRVEPVPWSEASQHLTSRLVSPSADREPQPARLPYRKPLRAPGRVPRGVLEAALNATQPRPPREVINANRLTGVKVHVFSL